MTLTAASRVTGIPATEPNTALEHFEKLLALETDCWDVHADLAGGAPEFVLLDVRSPESFKAAHVPRANNLPHARLN
jgi:hypothetical protein